VSVANGCLLPELGEFHLAPSIPASQSLFAALLAEVLPYLRATTTVCHVVQVVVVDIIEFGHSYSVYE